MSIFGPFVFALIMRWQTASVASEVLRHLEPYRPTLVEGLKGTQFVITMPEFEAITKLNRTAGITRIIYVNGFGEARWYKDPNFGNRCSLGTEALDLPIRTTAPERAFRIRAAVYARAPNGVLEIAVPFLDRGRVIGMLILESPLRRIWNARVTSSRAFSSSCGP